MKTPLSIVIVILALLLLGGPPPAEGQTVGNIPHVGIIHYSGEQGLWVDGLRQGLRELGLEDGKQLVLDIRQTAYDLKAVEAAASDLERAKVDLLYTVTTSLT